MLGSRCSKFFYIRFKLKQLSQQPTPAWRKRALLLIKLLLSAGAIYLIIRKVNAQQVWHYMASANWLWLFAAFAVFFVSKAVSAVRLNLFFKQNNVRLTEKQNLFLYLLGMFYNLFVPLVGGEAYKIYFISTRQQIPVKKLVWASLLDRASGLLGLTAFALLYFTFSSFSYPYKQLAPLLIPLGYILWHSFIFLLFKEYKSAVLRTNLLSLVVQGTQLLCSFCVLMALGVEQHMTDYLFIFLLSCYAYIVPVIGAREMAFVFGAKFMGLDMNLSLAISLFFYLSMAVTSLTGVVFLFFPQWLEKEA